MGDDADDDVSDSGEWMTYGTLASLRGITRRAAVRLAQRHRWRRQPGNDAFARIWVPTEFLKPPERTRDVAGDGGRRPSGDAPDVAGDVARAIKALEAAVATLREANAQLTEARTAAEGKVAALEEHIAGVRAHLAATQVELDQANARAVTAEAELSTARADLAAARDAAERARASSLEAHDRAETLVREIEAGKGRGRWARLWAAWRGE